MPDPLGAPVADRALEERQAAARRGARRRGRVPRSSARRRRATSTKSRPAPRPRPRLAPGAVRARPWIRAVRRRAARRGDLRGQRPRRHGRPAARRFRLAKGRRRALGVTGRHRARRRRHLAASKFRGEAATPRSISTPRHARLERVAPRRRRSRRSCGGCGARGATRWSSRSTRGLPMPWGPRLCSPRGGIGRAPRPQRRGLPAEVATFGAPAWPAPCATARAGDAALAACSARETRRDLLRARSASCAVTFDGGARRVVYKPRVVACDNGDAELRSSPSGGLLFMRSCGAEDREDVACVKQPDGKWLTVKSAKDDDELDLGGRGAGPLADGRVAFLRGVRAPDEPEPRDEDGHEATGPRVVALGADGRERTLVTARRTRPEGRARRGRRARVQEDDRSPRCISCSPSPTGRRWSSPRPAGTRRACSASAARPSRGSRAITASPSAIAQRPRDERRRRLVGRRGRAAERARSRVAPRERRQARRGRGRARQRGRRASARRCGSAGVRPPRPCWAAPTRRAAPRQALRAPSLADRALSLGAPARWLTCTSRGGSGAHAPPSQAGEIKPRSRGPRRRRTRRTATISVSRGALRRARRCRRARARRGARSADASTWTLRWLDPLSIGDAPHAVTLPAPLKGAMTARVAFASARGADALFKIVAYDQTKGEEVTYVVRAHGAGRPEVAEVKPDLAPVDASEVVFGGARVASVAWLKRSALVVWRMGEPPRRRRRGRRRGHALPRRGPGQGRRRPRARRRVRVVVALRPVRRAGGGARAGAARRLDAITASRCVGHARARVRARRVGSTRVGATPIGERVNRRRERARVRHRLCAPHSRIGRCLCRRRG